MVRSIVPGTLSPSLLSFTRLSGHAAHIASKDGINLACNRRGEFSLYKCDSGLCRLLGLFLADASLLHDYINEFVHPYRYGGFVLEQRISTTNDSVGSLTIKLAA